jgi:uncharacterized membrane protein YbaN (DUF454 family)
MDIPQPPGEFGDSAPFREPSVVHSSFGRLRVHLPHWSCTRAEEVAAAARGLPGVTGAETNPLTGNVLIRFEPRQTGAGDLLEALPALRLSPPLLQVYHGPPVPAGETDLPKAVPESALEEQPAPAVVYMTGTGRVVYRALGWSSVGMAVVGAITPGIPTAPFVILAGYFFTRSSPEAHEWLRQTRWFGPLLRDWEKHRGVRRWVRNAAVALIGGGMAVTALLGLSAPVTATILTLQVVGLAIVLHLRVIDPVQGPGSCDSAPAALPGQ